MSQALKIIFAGTPEFAARALDALLASPHRVLAVYTQPDRPAGRGRKLTPSPVKQRALAAGIEVRQPATLKDAAEQQALRELDADVMVVAAYGLLLPKAVLEIPRLGCINIHASLLPAWRGAAPIQRAILHGDRETGITIMQMDEGLDTGDILLMRACPIGEDDTAASLHDKLAELGAETLVEALDALAAGHLQARPQDHDQASYAHKLDKAEAWLEWDRPARELERRVRAFNPWPVAQTRYGDKTLRIWQARSLDEAPRAAPGTVIAAGKQGVDVATGEGVLRLLELQLPGGKPQPAASFVNAHDLSGVRLG